MVQIKSLPKTQRDVIVSKIKEIKGLTQRQTARILGISPNLIFKAIKEAREPSLCFCATCASFPRKQENRPPASLLPGSKRTVPLLPPCFPLRIFSRSQEDIEERCGKYKLKVRYKVKHGGQYEQIHSKRNLSSRTQFCEKTKAVLC